VSPHPCPLPAAKIGGEKIKVRGFRGKTPEVCSGTGIFQIPILYKYLSYN